MDILLPEYKQMLLLLVKHDVNFMLIGGYAVIYHGYERSTTDMDIWLQPDNNNRDKLILALSEFGIGHENLDLLAQKDFNEITFFYFGERPRRIDFLTRINGVIFDEAEKEVQSFPFENVQIPIIQYYHLIRSKISNNRPQDKADVEMLQKIHAQTTENKDNSVLSFLKRLFKI